MGCSPSQLPAPGDGGDGVTDHPDLTGRSNSDQHPQSAITGLVGVLAGLDAATAAAVLAANDATTEAQTATSASNAATAAAGVAGTAATQASADVDAVEALLLPLGAAGFVLSSTGSGTQWVAPSGGVPSARTITAGQGIEGGGDLSADRTISVNDIIDNAATEYTRRRYR